MDLGNAGSPALNIILPIGSPTGFRTGINPWFAYTPANQTKKYWNTPRPFTDVKYTQGQGRLLQLDFLFVRNISKLWQAGVEINRFGSKGVYLRQNSDYSSFRTFHRFESPNKKWVLRYQIFVMNASAEINGGMTSDSLFTQAGYFQRESFPVRLNSSVIWSKASKQTFESDYHLRPKKAASWLKPSGSASSAHLLNLAISRDRERTADSSLVDDISSYPFTFRDSTRNFDSLTFTNFQTALTWRSISMDSLKNTKINWALGFGFDKFNFNNHFNLEMSAYNWSIKGHITYDRKEYQAYLKVLHYFSGYNQGDYLIVSGLHHEGPKIKWNLQWQTQKYRQAFTWERFNSNHYRWAQSLLPGINNGLSGYLKSNPHRIIPWQLTFQLGTLKEYVVVHSQAIPRQLDENLLNASLEGFFTLHYKKIYWSQRGFIQKNNQPLTIQLPEWGINSEISLRSRYKKTSLNYQIGVILDQRQKTLAWTFNPSTMMWGRDTTRQMGGYPMLHFFAAGEIKRFSCFIRMEHFLYNLQFISATMQKWNPLPTDYFASAGNPMQPQLFRFGFRWRFYD